MPGRTRGVNQIRRDRGAGRLRVAAWSFEETVLWRGADAARLAGSRAAVPLRWVQRQLLWPIGDLFSGVRKPAALGVVTGLAVTILVLGAVLLIVSGKDGEPSAPAAPEPLAADAPAENAATLQGVAPDFTAGPGAESIEIPKGAAAIPAQQVQEPLRVARRFADAFVLYEIGNSGDKVANAFATTTTPSLARSLEVRPPRLPEGKVPKARVSNLVPRARRGRELEVSVAITRLSSLSELRLTLTRTEKRGWRVSEVRG